MARTLPRYPVYVPSKSRHDYCLTAMQLVKDEVPFYLVVEPQQEEDYRKEWEGAPGVKLLVLPHTDQGLHTTRNWIMEHSVANGDERHWQVDDNIRHWGMRYKAKRMRMDAGIAMRACEALTDRYENVGVSGLDYYMFVPDHAKIPPMSINCHVYSNSLVNNSIPYRWRQALNDDTDFCLQILAGGLCTILIHAFLVQKLRTMIAKGGNTDDFYKKKDGRLKMARTLERRWPGVVSVDRRFQRPQHIIKGQWKMFDTLLKVKPGVDLNAPVIDLDVLGVKLKQVAPEIKSDYIKSLKRQWEDAHGE